MQPWPLSAIVCLLQKEASEPPNRYIYSQIYLLKTLSKYFIALLQIFARLNRRLSEAGRSTLVPRRCFYLEGLDPKINTMP